MTHLHITVRYLDDRYHGLLDRGKTIEWPPSPFRLFQALVAGVGRRGELDSPIGESLAWLQKLEPPIIIAPKHRVGQAITRFVPNNDGDKKFDRQERLAAKPTIPTLFLLEPNQKPEVHYVWDISDAPDAPLDRIRDAARSLTTLGWGIDMAFADADRADEAKLQRLKGVRWYPKKYAWRNDGMLRTPTYDPETEDCTLCDLRHCHSTFINRIEHGKPLKTVDKPKVFDRVLYTSIERPIGRPVAVFKLIDENGEPIRPAHSQARLIYIAGMVRHLAIERMKFDPPEWKNGEPKWLETFVCGHRGNEEQHQQISYIPLPSIGHEHADALIRNVMLVAPFECERELEYVAERIDGLQLQPENQIRSIGLDKSPAHADAIHIERLNPSSGKFISKCYLAKSSCWQTVTPVILDGHNRKSKADKSEKIAHETEKLICKALKRAGIETPCKFTWQSIPFLKNTLSAHKYDRNGRHTGYHRPSHLRDLTAIHVELVFTHPVCGPLIIGAGRHCGFGLMAGADES